MCALTPQIQNLRPHVVVCNDPLVLDCETPECVTDPSHPLCSSVRTPGAGTCGCVTHGVPTDTEGKRSPALTAVWLARNTAEVAVGSSDEVDSSLSVESASELCLLDKSASESGPLAESAESPPYTPR